MADIRITPLVAFGSAQLVRWDVVCLDCGAGRSFSSQTDLSIWLAAHRDSCGLSAAN